MKETPIPAHAMARAICKRGRPTIYSRLDPTRTALLVIDMQQHYIESIGRIGEIDHRVDRLVGALRERGCLVVWLLNTLSRDGVDLWPHYHRHFFSPEQASRHCAGLAAGSTGHALLEGLQPSADDLVLEKTRFSAFAPSSSTLNDELIARGIDSLVIAGVATNVCCESTARDAMMRDMKVVAVHDAMAAVTDEDHRSGLAAMYSCFADVRSCDEVLAGVIAR